MSIINAGTTTGIQLTNDNTGNLYLQYGTGTTALTINNSGAFGLGSGIDYGIAGQYLGSSGSGSVPTWQSPPLTLGKVLGVQLTFGWFK